MAANVPLRQIGDEDELEALRLAALSTLRAKVAARTQFVPQPPLRNIPPFREFPRKNQLFQRHHNNSNLISIVPVADTTSSTVAPITRCEPAKLVLPQHRYCSTGTVARADADRAAAVSKFDRYDKSDSSSDSESSSSPTRTEADSDSEEDVLMMEDRDEEASLDQLITQLEDPMAARTAVVKPMLAQHSPSPRISPVRQPIGTKSPPQEARRSRSPFRPTRNNSPVQPIRNRSPERLPIRNRSPERQPTRNRSPERQAIRNRSPVRQPIRSRSPDRQLARNRSPDRPPLRPRSPVRPRMRSRSPLRPARNISPWSPPRRRSPRPVRRPSRSRASHSPARRYSPVRAVNRRASNSPKRGSGSPGRKSRTKLSPSLSLSPSPAKSPPRIAKHHHKKSKKSSRKMEARKKKFETNQPIASEAKLIRLRPLSATQPIASEIKSRLGPMVNDEPMGDEARNNEPIGSEVKSRLGDVIGGETKRGEPIGSEIKARLGTVKEETAIEMSTNEEAAEASSTNDSADLRAELSRRRAQRMIKKNVTPALVGSRLVQSAILDLVNRNPRGAARSHTGPEGSASDSLSRKVRLKRTANQVDFDQTEAKTET